MTKPKPCPFCKKRETSIKRGDSYSWVLCGNCGATGPDVYGPPGKATDEDAVAKWNERKGEAK